MLLFSLAGVPPLAGFFAKWYVFVAAINAHLITLAVDRRALQRGRRILLLPHHRQGDVFRRAARPALDPMRMELRVGAGGRRPVQHPLCRAIPGRWSALPRPPRSRFFDDVRARSPGHLGGLPAICLRSRSVRPTPKRCRARAKANADLPGSSHRSRPPAADDGNRPGSRRAATSPAACSRRSMYRLQVAATLGFAAGLAHSKPR